MTVQTITQALRQQGILISSEADSLEIQSIGYDSRSAEPGMLFLCKGAAFKPEYLLKAAERGAVCYLADQRYPTDLPAILVSNLRRALAVASAAFYENPAQSLDLLGITGTKGKTTTAFLTRAILRASGETYGLLSSVLTDTGFEEREAHLTTPEAPDLQRMLAEIRDGGAKGAVLEVSSQGLATERVWGVNFARAAFLNIGQDHISPIEHKDFADYFGAKKKICEHAPEVLVNLDAPFSEEFMEHARQCGCRVVTFGQDERAEIRAINLSSSPAGSRFTVVCPEFEQTFELPLLGAFNVSNALAAIGLCRGRVAPAQMALALKSASVPGRMVVLNGVDITVIVDYAHNKMSFETLFGDLRREFPGRRLISIFGCPGGKAFLRRKDLAEAAGQLTDHIVLTAEDPNFDDVDEINEQISSYIRPTGTSYESIPDRAEAVLRTISTARPGDVIVITGKGEETYQKVAGEYLPFEGDIPLSQRALAQRNPARCTNPSAEQ